MKRNLRKEKGITLIALILTIIILVVLAGISVRLVTKDSLIGKSTEATGKYNNSVAEEQNIINDYIAKIEDYRTVNNGNRDENNYYENNYSTTEQVIGKWIDGSPIYRKVVTLSYTPVWNEDYTFISNSVSITDRECHVTFRFNSLAPTEWVTLVSNIPTEVRESFVGVVGYNTSSPACGAVSFGRVIYYSGEKNALYVVDTHYEIADSWFLQFVTNGDKLINVHTLGDNTTAILEYTKTAE